MGHSLSNKWQLLLQPLVNFLDVFVASTAATVTATSIFLMEPYATFSDPVAKHSAHSVRFHIKMNGNIVQRCDLTF
jgi:hypothetical protein